MPSFPKIGDEVLITISSTENNHIRIKWESLPGNWSCRLSTRVSKLYKVGDIITGWIYRINFQQRCYYISDNNFGRLHISDRMRPRYLLALRHVIPFLVSNESKTSPSDLSSHLSEIKGMYNRSRKQDQWDWYTVWTSLGRPTFYEQRLHVKFITELIQQIKNNGLRLGIGYLNSSLPPDLVIQLEKSLKYIENTASLILSAKKFESYPEDISDEELFSLIKNRFQEKKYVNEKLKSAVQSHTFTLRKIVSRLQSFGYLVERSRMVDAFCLLKTGPAFFEVKSITSDNERTQIRKAFSQLHEYRFLYSLKDASLWLVLSKKPEQVWLIDFCQKHRIGVIWFNGGVLQGDFSSRINESGSEKKRRMNSSVDE